MDTAPVSIYVYAQNYQLLQLSLRALPALKLGTLAAAI